MSLSISGNVVFFLPFDSRLSDFLADQLAALWDICMTFISIIHNEKKKSRSHVAVNLINLSQIALF